MAKKKVSTLDKVTRTVTKAAKSVVATADEYLVEPVGKALGLTKKKPTRKKSTASKYKTATKATGTKAAKTARKTGGAKAVRK